MPASSPHAHTSDTTHKTQMLEAQTHGSLHTLALVVHLALPTLSALGLTLALAQTFSTARVFLPGLYSLMAGVLLVYIGDRLLEPGRIARSLHVALWVAAALAALVCVGCAVGFPERLFAVQTLLGVSAGLYAWLKRYVLAKTTVVAATWWLACSLLPIETQSGEVPFVILPSLQALSLALMVAAGAIMCDYKDEASDLVAHVNSWPLYLGHRRAVVLTIGLALAASILAWRAGAWALASSALLIALLGLSPRLLARPLLGPMMVDGCLALSGLCAWVLGL